MPHTPTQLLPGGVARFCEYMLSRRIVGMRIFMRKALIVFGALAFSLLHPAAAVAGPALLFEASSGKVIYAEDPDRLWHPASLTKIMTAYVAFEAIKEGRLTKDSKIVASEVSVKEPPSKVGLPVGASISLDLALKALIVKSANDVAVMLAEAVSGDVGKFVERMNATAKRLGMTRTHFANPNGLPEDAQVTTARDLAKLSQAMVRDFPQYAELWSMPSFTIGKQRLSSHNGLLRTFEGADGLKTGFICDSGFNIVASATRDGLRLMAVVLGEPSAKDRTIRASSLLEYGFEHYGWKMFFSTINLDTLPVDQRPQPVASIRDKVLSWGCGYRPSKSVKRNTLKRRKKALAAARAKKRAKESAHDDSFKPTTTSSVNKPATVSGN